MQNIYKGKFFGKLFFLQTNKQTKIHVFSTSRFHYIYANLHYDDHHTRWSNYLNWSLTYPPISMFAPVSVVFIHSVIQSYLVIILMMMMIIVRWSNKMKKKKINYVPPTTTTLPIFHHKSGEKNKTKQQT